ncbi:hypothetical protein Tco_1291456 [Tanacetum coccineum]
MSSDSASSDVTYTSISSHGDPLAWAVDFFRLQEPDSSEAAPASPDYVPGPEEPEQAPLSPDYVPGPEYPEYLAPSDEKLIWNSSRSFGVIRAYSSLEDLVSVKIFTRSF